MRLCCLFYECGCVCLLILSNQFQNFLQVSFLLTVDILKTTSVDKLPNDLEGMETSMERLLALIDDIYKYVDNVVVSDVWVSYFF